MRGVALVLLSLSACSVDRDVGSGSRAGAAGAGTFAGGSGFHNEGPAAAGRPATGGSPVAGGAGKPGGGRAGSAAASGAGSSVTAGSSGAQHQAGTAGVSSANRGVRVDGRVVRVDGAPFHVQGVCWNPVRRGGVHPTDLDFSGAAAVDIPLMAAAGVNAVRTYEPLRDAAVLDALYSRGIYVLNTVYPYGGSSVSAASELVTALRDHPAILMWVIGNEWNYNGLYVGLSHEEALVRLNAVAAAVRAADPAHPIATVYGELPSADTIARMPDIDVWGLNVYRGLGFGTLFEDWARLSPKRFFLAEYGADAWNATVAREDTASQAEATRALTALIRQHSAALSADGTCAGGAIFEWADEWWKDPEGSPTVHDVGGSAPGGGPHPDATFNEEWWGLLDVDRNPRPAYRELATIYTQ